MGLRQPGAAMRGSRHLTTTSTRDASRTAASSSRLERHADRARGRNTTSPRTDSRSSASDVARLRELVAKALDDLKAREVCELDVRGRCSFADWLVVASGTSSRHVRSIADEVIKLAKQANLPPLGAEGVTDGEWALVDLGDVVVHVMLPRVREFYGIERLWSVDGGDADQPLH